jgi:hypothetical protein
VIDVLLPLFILLTAPTRGLADVVETFVKIQGGHADLREIELVRAVEISAIRELIGHEHPPLLLDQSFAMASSDDFPAPSCVRSRVRPR